MLHNLCKVSQKRSDLMFFAATLLLAVLLVGVTIPTASAQSKARITFARRANNHNFASVLPPLG